MPNLNHLPTVSCPCYRGDLTRACCVSSFAIRTGIPVPLRGLSTSSLHEGMLSSPTSICAPPCLVVWLTSSTFFLAQAQPRLGVSQAHGLMLPGTAALSFPVQFLHCGRPVELFAVEESGRDYTRHGRLHAVFFPHRKEDSELELTPLAPPTPTTHSPAPCLLPLGGH